MGQSCLHRFKMLSFYVIMLLCLSFSVDAESSNCQKKENSICRIRGIPRSAINPCCEGLVCVKLKDGHGYSFCRKPNDPFIYAARGEKCKVKKGIFCKKNLTCKNGECVKKGNGKGKGKGKGQDGKGKKEN